MSEDYKVQISISLPPSAQYAKGDMMNVRGADTDDLFAALTALFDADAAKAIIAKFRSYAISVPDFMNVEQVAEALNAPPAAPTNSWGTGGGRSSGGFTSGGGGGGGRKAVTEKQIGLIQRTAKEKGLSLDQLLDLASQTTNKGFRPKSLDGLSSFEASKLIDLLRDSAGNVAV